VGDGAVQGTSSYWHGNFGGEKGEMSWVIDDATKRGKRAKKERGAGEQPAIR